MSLNEVERIEPTTVLARMSYEHPVYTLDAVRARDELLAADGERRTHYAGAYLGADTPKGVKAALGHPEVACVLVPPERRELLDLDLTALTYG